MTMPHHTPPFACCPTCGTCTPEEPMEYADTRTVLDTYTSLPDDPTVPIIRAIIATLMDHRGEAGAEEVLRMFANGFEEG